MSMKSIINLPTPISISTLWNMGFMLGIILSTQIISGLILSMMYSPEANLAFYNVNLIMKEIENGWITRILHANGASAFFMVIYMHLARGVYFSSPTNQKKTWTTGMALMLMTMATAFLGYVLPWGQMSFWGATVITGTISAIPTIGKTIITWIWGSSSVSQPTLNRFFSLHFLLPMLISATVMIHLMTLHEKGSSNPKSTNTNMDKMNFHPLMLSKDTTPIMLLTTMLIMLTLLKPLMFMDTENFNPANPLMAPMHIQPEWYFLFAYVILRSVPSKLGGVIALVMSLLILTTCMMNKNKTTKFNTTKKMKLWAFASTVVILTWIGAKPVETPFETIGKIYSTFYFSIVVTL